MDIPSCPLRKVKCSSRIGRYRLPPLFSLVSSSHDSNRYEHRTHRQGGVYPSGLHVADEGAEKPHDNQREPQECELHFTSLDAVRIVLYPTFTSRLDVPGAKSSIIEPTSPKTRSMFRPRSGPDEGRLTSLRQRGTLHSGFNNPLRSHPRQPVHAFHARLFSWAHLTLSCQVK